MTTEKEKLKLKLEEIERKEKVESENKKKKENYEKFKKRYEDYVIGKAHADINLQSIDYRWREETHTIGKCISIHGNCGTSYNAETQITSATHIYFHNVWTDKQRKSFQDKLNKVALKEINKIMNTLPQKLEIMGLQSTYHYLDNLYPKDKINEIKKDIWKETCKVLDKYSDKQFTDLIQVEKFWRDMKTGEKVEQFKDVSLSHSNAILFRYIKEKRENLIKKFSECKHWNTLTKKRGKVNE